MAHVIAFSPQSFLKIHFADHTLMCFWILQNSATSAAQTQVGTSAAQPKLDTSAGQRKLGTSAAQTKPDTSAAAKAAESQAAVQPAGGKRFPV